jgi:hypothetical protein
VANHHPKDVVKKTKLIMPAVILLGVMTVLPQELVAQFLPAVSSSNHPTMTRAVVLVQPVLAFECVDVQPSEEVS